MERAMNVVGQFLSYSNPAGYLDDPKIVHVILRPDFSAVQFSENKSLWIAEHQENAHLFTNDFLDLLSRKVPLRKFRCPSDQSLEEVFLDTIEQIEIYESGWKELHVHGVSISGSILEVLKFEYSAHFFEKTSYGFKACRK